MLKKLSLLSLLLLGGCCNPSEAELNTQIEKRLLMMEQCKGLTEDLGLYYSRIRLDDDGTMICLIEDPRPGRLDPAFTSEEIYTIVRYQVIKRIHGAKK